MEPGFSLKAPWQRFAVCSAAAWLVLAIICSFIVGISTNTEPAYLAAVPLGILILALSRSYEIRLRRTHLPREGWTPWCFRLTLMLCVVAGWMGYMEQHYRCCIPGLCLSALTTERDFTWITKDGSTGKIKGISSEESRDVTRDLALRGTFSFSSPRLRFYSRKHPEGSGWVVHSRSGPLIRESDGKSQPWNGDGLLQVMEELSGATYRAAERPHASAIANAASLTWSRGEPFDFANVEIMRTERGGYRFSEISGKSIWHIRVRPWWGAVVFGSIWALIAAGIFFSAKATMGSSHGQPAPDEQD
jgi:hypothetical protein